ncbi:MAG: HupE/UreJ family protein [Cyanobacteria bacterium]|nr:HupE/UreJ family protein [Cyanobacteriota bacterium]
MNLTIIARSLAPLALFAAVAVVLADQPAQAHGLAAGGITAGFLHPLTGTDHLLLLISVGAAASYISSQLLLWGLVGGIARAISAVAVLMLRSYRASRAPSLALGVTVIAAAVAVHATLHGQEAPDGGAASV